MKLAVVSAGLSSPSSTRLLADRLTAATLARLDAEPETVELRNWPRRSPSTSSPDSRPPGWPPHSTRWRPRTA
ncbi:hypothetical protein JYK04_08221 [Streptomyces nojiriensis]|nr:hypothetical protein JYK04_08221 [Streptomyces nojiriensis]